MSCLRTLFLVVIGLPLFGTGCVAPQSNDVDEEVRQTELEVSGSQDHSRIVTNGLVASSLTSNRDALLDLAGRSLSPAAIAASPLLKDPQGRDLLAYVVKCAFDWGARIEIPHGGATVTFEGGVGLAESWAYGALTVSGQRWMTACLLAHANAYGIRVPLSLRGDHPGLATTLEEEQAYTIEEGAYYGNLFDRSGGKPQLLACWGRSADDPCASSKNKWLDDRVCAVGDASESACGFFVPGPCYEPERGVLRACTSAGPNGYSDCYPSVLEPSSTPMGYHKVKGYAEVITVFLREDTKLMAPIECAPNKK